MRHLVISLLICSLVGCAGSPRNTSLKSAKALRSVDTYTLCKAATPRELYTPSQKVLNEVRRRRVNCSSIYSYVSPSEKRKAAKRAAQRLRESLDPSSLLACEQYSQLVYNHIMGNRTPPTLRQVVVINQRRPTEYEGEITGCGMFSCTVELRETYRSRWNRQFQQTSDNLGQSVEELGYAIGQAAARSSLRKKAEKQKEAKFQECARAATSR
jgi:hypothetical protein